MAGSSSIEAREIALDGARITWLEAGEGPALVLLHGIGSGARSWSRQLPYFASHYRVVAWNAPGYGGSTHLPADAPVAADYALRLGMFLDAVGIGPCHMVGHSLGSLMAGSFAASNPARIRSLTLASCAIGHAHAPSDVRERSLRGRIKDVDVLGPRGMAEKRGPRLLGPTASPEAIRAVVETMALVDPKGYAQAARMLSQGDLLADVARLPDAMPLQVIYGSADVITPPEVNRRVAAVRAGVALHEISDGGHAVYVEKSAAFNAVLSAFLEASDVRA